MATDFDLERRVDVKVAIPKHVIEEAVHLIAHVLLHVLTSACM